MSQQEADPSRYTRTLVVKPALSQMYDQVEVPNGMQKQLHSYVGAPSRACAWILPRVHKNKSMQRLISSLWGPGTAKFQVT